MAKYDRIFSFLWIALGTLQSAGSLSLGLGDVAEPGTGFMPFVMGLVMIVLGGALLLESSLALKKNPKSSDSLWSGGDWKKVFSVLLLLTAYAVLLPWAGYLVATFLVMVFLLKSGGSVKWAPAILAGILTSGISYLVFGIWLNVAFPRGILSF